MLGYRLVKVETRPAEAWRELKDTANRLAEQICETITEAAREAESISGQRVPKITIWKGNFRITAERNAPFTSTREATWPRVFVRNTAEGWGKSLPDRPPKGEDNPLWTHWDLQAGKVRKVIEVLRDVSAEDISAAVDAALDDEGQ